MLRFIAPTEILRKGYLARTVTLHGTYYCVDYLRTIDLDGEEVIDASFDSDGVAYGALEYTGPDGDTETVVVYLDHPETTGHVNVTH